MFRIKEEQHILKFDDICDFCNLKGNEDVYHFLFECKIHNSSGEIFLKDMLQTIQFRRKDFLIEIVQIPLSYNVKIFHFLNCSIKRRKLILDLDGV